VSAGAVAAGELLHGVGVSPGIAIGRALVLEGAATPVPRRPIDPASCDAEVARFEKAVRRAALHLRSLRDRVRAEAGTACARVFQAQILILKDPTLAAETQALVRDEQVCAEWAVQAVLGRYLRMFDEVRDTDLRDRGSDIDDVRERLVGLLTGRRRRRELESIDGDVVIVGPTLSPSDAAGLALPGIVALALDGGGPTSHTAIIAGALGIPAVVGLRSVSARVRTGDRVVVDGQSGVVHLLPGDDEIAEWRRRAAGRARITAAAPAVPSTTTRDGLGVCLLANVKVPEEVAAARRLGAEGIGLYRSEFLYLRAAPDLPDEAEQTRVYGDLAAEAAPHEVVIRTLDLGGEEGAANLLGAREANPVLGLRGIRLGLRRPEMLRVQLRAILRAGLRGKVRILLPMVSGTGEVAQARALLAAARAELAAEGIACAGAIPLGVMIEVPAAALIAPRLAAVADFFAIGTNDLIQYTLAIDRGNEAVAYLYEPLHPAVLTLLRGVVDAATARGVRVSVCGEMAANPLFAVVLVGLGVTELSMSPAAIPLVRRVIGAITAQDARAIASEALALAHPTPPADLVRRRVITVLPPEVASLLEEPSP